MWNVGFDIFRFGVHCTLVPEQVGPGSSSFFHLPARRSPRAHPSPPCNGRCSLKMRTSARLERAWQTFLDREWLQKTTYTAEEESKERCSFINYAYAYRKGNITSLWGDFIWEKYRNLQEELVYYKQRIILLMIILIMVL